MSKVAMAVHGGAATLSPFIKKNFNAIEDGLAEALSKGHRILKRGGSALKAVETAVMYLEDNELFNAGRGSALNANGEVEMDAAIMDGRTLDAGAVSMVRTVKNPISLAKTVMQKTKHVFLSGYGAIQLAEQRKIILEPDAYFITDYQYQEFLKTKKKNNLQKMLQQKVMGTVGAVAVDKNGNVAAATSTGGTANCLPGRIGDSCVIGAGCYANNKTCAVSGTGRGEVLITGVVAHTIAMLVEVKKYTLQEACDYVIHRRRKNVRGDIGVIAVNARGEIGISFNTQMMKRAWVGPNTNMQIKIL